jgi:hypothetical protein
MRVYRSISWLKPYTEADTDNHIPQEPPEEVFVEAAFICLVFTTSDPLSTLPTLIAPRVFLRASHRAPRGPLEHLRARNDLEVSLGYTTQATVEIKHRTETINIAQTHQK